MMIKIQQNDIIDINLEGYAKNFKERLNLDEDFRIITIT